MACYKKKPKKREKLFFSSTKQGFIFFQEFTTPINPRVNAGS
jgi:hypothetical protein